MSSDYYFRKFKEILIELQTLVEFDINCQTAKVNDKTLCQATQRWTSILGHYMVLYNELTDLVYENLQVQKTEYFNRIVKSLLSRITELKHNLQKIEKTNVQFLGPLSDKHLTTYDAEMSKLPLTETRPAHIQEAIDKIFTKAREIREAALNPPNEEEGLEEEIDQWWLTEEEDDRSKQIEGKVPESEITEEMRITEYYVNMIKAHEKTRQVIRRNIKKKLCREKWEKELTGTLNPPARYEIRDKSAEIIQKVMRSYFQMKREKIKDFKRMEILGLSVCNGENLYKQRNIEKQYAKRSNLLQSYKEEWMQHRQDMKEKYLKKKKEELLEDFRDQIREWFMEWFNTIQFIHSIPKEGPAAIFTGDISDPNEWLEEYEEYLKQKKANQNTSNRKFQQMEEKRQMQLLKREEEKKKKLEEQLLRKMMKNPSLHPGYEYPLSKTTDLLRNDIKQYYTIWFNYDERNTIDVKEKYVMELDYEDAIKEAKLEILSEVVDDMRKEFRKLKNALKLDYEANEEEMPEEFNNTHKRKKSKKRKNKKAKDAWNDKVHQKFEDLAIEEYIVEYPSTKLQEFIGDPNFAGSDLRCKLRSALPFNYEVRSLWWDVCRESTRGFHKILLIGARGSGKIKLVHALASLNDAILFDLDLFHLQKEDINPDYLNNLILNVVACAKAVQPAVIHIKHVQKLFYKKVPSAEKSLNLKLIKTYFIQKLWNKINNTDRITIIGTGSEPWVARSSQMLKRFPQLLLLPITYHSLIVELLNDWVKRYKVIPCDFNVSSLAQVLQGYSFGYLQKALDMFMTADQIAKVAAHGLRPMEVYNFIIEDITEEKVDFNKYIEWYNTHTSWGQKEKKHKEEMLEFQAAVERYEAQDKKNRRKPASANQSHTTI